MKSFGLQFFWVNLINKSFIGSKPSFVLMLPLKWEQASTVKSVFQLITGKWLPEFLYQTERRGKRAR